MIFYSEIKVGYHSFLSRNFNHSEFNRTPEYSAILFANLLNRYIIYHYDFHNVTLLNAHRSYLKTLMAPYANFCELNFNIYEFSRYNSLSLLPFAMCSVFYYIVRKAKTRQMYASSVICIGLP